MQDEDGYITLNIKSRKPPLSSVDPDSSSGWRVVALVLLVLSMGMVFGLVALGIISVTQHNYLQAEKDALSGTLQQLAKRFCQYIIQQSDQKDHKCSPCETKWRYYENSCYGFFRHNLTWDESKQFCMDFNATLVKAASPSILEYLKGKTSFIRWVGLSRQNSNKVWMWADGSILPKTKPGLSEDGKEYMDCAYFHKGQLHPTLCNSKHFLMCERKAGTVKVDQLL